MTETTAERALGDGAAGRRHGGARDVPDGAHRLLLPNARGGVRGRGRGPGDLRARLARLRPVRGAVVAPFMALPHRHERVPLDARRQPATGAADGPESGADRGHAAAAAAVRVGLGRAGPRQPGGARMATPPRWRWRASRCGSPSSPRSSICLHASGPSSSCARCFAGGRRRSGSCSGPRSHRSIRRSSGRARRWPADRPMAGRAGEAARQGERGAAGALRRGLRALRHGLADDAAPCRRDLEHAAIRALAGDPP